jgi:hypothetical protein
VFLLLACADPAPDPAPAPVEEPITPSAWSGVDAPADPARLTTGEQEQAVDAVIDAITSISPRVVHDAFDAALDHRASDCPEVEQRSGQIVVAGDCTTSAGWTWLGIGLRSSIQNMRIVLDDIDAFHREWEFSNGNVQLLGPDGELYQLTGTSMYRDYDATDGARSLAVEMWGEFGAQNVADLDDTWFSDDIAVELTLYATIGGDAVYTGGMSRLDGPAWAWSTDGLTLDDACPTEPTGTLRVLDPGGTWYAITFDAAACDGCGTSEDGTVCADFTSLVAFREDPWAG